MDATFLHQAFELARKWQGRCAPNPSVGAVIVKEGKVIARGWHQGPGTDHAEVMALKAVSSDDLEGASIYVTLEPCSHWGRTPPCVSAISQSALKRVVYAEKDVNPVVNGSGENELIRAGFEVRHLPTPEIHQFYEPYRYWHRTGLPWVQAKIALSLDGKISGPQGKPTQITGNGLKAKTHQARLESDAILTTAQTVVLDDPQLNARLNGESITRPVYVLDRLGKMPLTARLWSTASRIVIFHGSHAHPDRLEALSQRGALLVEVSEVDGQLNLEEVIGRCGKDGVHRLWVEAGGRLFESLVSEGRVQQGWIYLGAKWIGNGVSAFGGQVNWFDGAKSVHWSGSDNDGLCEVSW